MILSIFYSSRRKKKSLWKIHFSLKLVNRYRRDHRCSTYAKLIFVIIITLCYVDFEITFLITWSQSYTQWYPERQRNGSSRKLCFWTVGKFFYFQFHTVLNTVILLTNLRFVIVANRIRIYLFGWTQWLQIGIFFSIFLTNDPTQLTLRKTTRL